MADPAAARHAAISRRNHPAARRAPPPSTRPDRQQFPDVPELLTTQLKNQNPLDPLDTNQFTQQLVQFAQVEQQINRTSSSPR